MMLRPCRMKNMVTKSCNNGWCVSQSLTNCRHRGSICHPVTLSFYHCGSWNRNGRVTNGVKKKNNLILHLSTLGIGVKLNVNMRLRHAAVVYGPYKDKSSGFFFGNNFLLRNIIKSLLCRYILELNVLLLICQSERLVRQRQPQCWDLFFFYFNNRLIGHGWQSTASSFLYYYSRNKTKYSWSSTLFLLHSTFNFCHHLCFWPLSYPQRPTLPHFPA